MNLTPRRRVRLAVRDAYERRFKRAMDRHETYQAAERAMRPLTFLQSAALRVL